jgi:hypothetical protein
VAFRILSGFMAALFAFAVVVQYNDPDPFTWMAVYGAACVISVMVARRGTIPLLAVLVLGGLAVVWSLALLAGVPSPDTFASMFDAWEMKSAPIEEAREASGLAIVAAWMVVLAIRAWRGRAST